MKLVCLLRHLLFSDTISRGMAVPRAKYIRFTSAFLAFQYCFLLQRWNISNYYVTDAQVWSNKCIFLHIRYIHIYVNDNYLFFIYYIHLKWETKIKKDVRLFLCGKKKYFFFHANAFLIETRRNVSLVLVNILYDNTESSIMIYLLLLKQYYFSSCLYIEAVL